MRNPKRLTRDQKEYVTKNNLNWKEYGLIEEDKETLTIINRSTNEVLKIEKLRRKKK